jgi:hypothetical protein
MSNMKLWFVGLVFSVGACSLPEPCQCPKSYDVQSERCIRALNDAYTDAMHTWACMMNNNVYVIEQKWECTKGRVGQSRVGHVLESCKGVPKAWRQ